ncbi:alpha/beta-hydrolase N-terminal domain-containing protein [Actinomyces gerencseriae]|mgnify:FL=1|nr:alpha/beta-hydrolase N-terminal domain-containing protein [Actinomyces gerencseriae]
MFFILALTPSLLPRDVLSQGAPCGLCAGTGYPLGVWLSWNWRT